MNRSAPFDPDDRVAVWMTYEYALGTVISCARRRDIIRGVLASPPGLWWVTVVLDVSLAASCHPSSHVELVDERWEQDLREERRPFDPPSTKEID